MTNSQNKTLLEYLEKILKENNIEINVTDKDDNFIGMKKRIISDIVFNSNSKNPISVHLADGVAQQKMKFDKDYQMGSFEPQEGLLLEANEFNPNDSYIKFPPAEAQQYLLSFMTHLRSYINCWYDEYTPFAKMYNTTEEQENLNREFIMNQLDKIEKEIKCPPLIQQHNKR